jgi:26S proteasome regulatory subunit N6
MSRVLNERGTRQLLRVLRTRIRIMSSTADLLAEAEALGGENPKRREAIYKQILDASKSTLNPDELRDQETALVKLGELYRDQK